MAPVHLRWILAERACKTQGGAVLREVQAQGKQMTLKPLAPPARTNIKQKPNPSPVNIKSHIYGLLTSALITQYTMLVFQQKITRQEKSLKRQSKQQNQIQKWK